MFTYVVALNLEAVQDSRKTFEMQTFAKIVNGQKPLTIFTKHFILDTCGIPEYASKISD